MTDIVQRLCEHGDTWLTYETEAILMDVIEARGKIG